LGEPRRREPPAASTSPHTNGGEGSTQRSGILSVTLPAVVTPGART
jgi:hypothetical protein